MVPRSTKFFTDRVRIFENTDGVHGFPFEHCDLRQLIEAPYKGHKQTKAARKTFKRRNKVFSHDHRAISKICRDRAAQFRKWENARKKNIRLVLHTGGQSNHPGGPTIKDKEVPGPSNSAHQPIPASLIKLKITVKPKKTVVPVAGSNPGRKEEEATVKEPENEEQLTTRSNAKGTTRYPPNKVTKTKAKRVGQPYNRIRDPLRAAKEERRAPKVKGASTSQIEDDFALIALRRAQFAEEKRRGRNPRLFCAINCLRQHGVRNGSTVLPPGRLVVEPTPKQQPEPAMKEEGKIILNIAALKEKTIAYHDCMARSQRLNSRPRKPTDDYFVALQKEKEEPCLSTKQIEEIRDKHRYHPYLDHRVIFMRPEQTKLPERTFRVSQKDAREALTAAKKEVELKWDMVRMISLIEGCEDAMDLDSGKGEFILSAVPVWLRSESKNSKGGSSGIPLVLTRIEHGEEENSKWTVRKRSSLREELVLDEVASMRRQLDLGTEENTMENPIEAGLMAQKS